MLLAKSQQEHRISTFLQPFRNTGHGGRFYPNLFWSLIASTRYSSSPNIQNLPGKADTDEPWHEIVPAGSLAKQVTRNIIIAPSGHKLVSVDLKSAEPRYLAIYCQRALNITPDISGNIRLVNQERERRYPALAKLKKRMQQRAVFRRNSIEWPSYQEDPLWRVFKYGEFGGDPYVALLAACLPEEFAANQSDRKWVKKNRVVGKRGFLALTYGASAESLAPQLGWSVARTEAAIRSLDERFATIPATKELARRQVNRLGYVRTLYGRKRRINGYYQLASGLEPLEIAFTGTKKPNGRYDHYRLRIIVISTYRQGVIAFVEKAVRLFRESDQGEVVFSADPTTGNITHHDNSDLLFRADHFIDPPFRTLAYGRTEWVRDIYGFVRHLPRQESAVRSAFNGIFQGTGADHLREIQNTISSRIKYAKLILTMHDSLLFEVEASRVDRFLTEIRNYVQPPSWADIPFPLEAEVGDQFGSLDEV